MAGWTDGESHLSHNARLEAAVARRPRGLFTDIDGTISPIAPTPDAAELLPGVRELLVAACAEFDLVAAVSGRAALDARALVDLPQLLYIGSHGMERLEPHAPAKPDAVRVLPEAQAYVAVLDAILARVDLPLRTRYPGILIERKFATASIHYRNTADPAAARAGILSALTTATAGSEVLITHGKMLVELRPAIPVDKGTAIVGMVREAGLVGAVFLGDDRTDEDAFRALRRLTDNDECRGASVAVLHPEAPVGLATNAEIALPDIEQVPALLAWLIACARAADRA